MRARPFASGLLWAMLALAIAIGAARPAPAQSDDDILALNKQVGQLIKDSKLAEATPPAERSIALTKARRGEDLPCTPWLPTTSAESCWR